MPAGAAQVIRRRLIAVDLRLGRAWSRLGGVIFLAIAGFSTISLIESRDFSLASHWPGLAIAGLFFIAAIACFRSRRGLMDTISDNHPSRGG